MNEISLRGEISLRENLTSLLITSSFLVCQQFKTAGRDTSYYG